jgi:hypothetical protein
MAVFSDFQTTVATLSKHSNMRNAIVKLFLQLPEYIVYGNSKDAFINKYNTRI